MPDAKPVPRMGLGTFGRTGDAGIEALLVAIEVGFRHLDTAQSYDTEAQVGEAMRRSGLSRDDFFVTTKVADTRLDKAHFMPSVERSLQQLGVDQVDLLLIHWPSERDRIPFEDYMLALADAKARGHARSIGVSNFPAALLDRSVELLGKGEIVTNQVEIHPYLQARRLCARARELGIPLTAYQPLACGEVRNDATLRKIADAHGVTVSTVTLAFLLAEGHNVIPASSSREHLRANFAADDLRLTETEIAEIRSLDRGYRRINPAKSPKWDD